MSYKPSKVGLHVRENVVFQLKKLPAHVTLDLPTAGVPEGVFLERRLPREPLPALLALTVLLAGV